MLEFFEIGPVIMDVHRMRETGEPTAVLGVRTGFLRVAAGRRGPFVGPGRNKFVIPIHIANASLPGRGRGSSRRFASVRPVCPGSFVIGIAPMT